MIQLILGRKSKLKTRKKMGISIIDTAAHKEARQDILNSLNQFNNEELEAITNDYNTPVFSSDEFYQIFYYSNSELYYLDEETQNNLKETADKIEDTEKGRIFCFE